MKIIIIRSEPVGTCVDIADGATAISNESGRVAVLYMSQGCKDGGVELGDGDTYVGAVVHSYKLAS
ncbi:hypothetical protein ACIBEJ_47700 [Nonomuraea sp. NPDC050790]|uniref:hypothetical protein n=1 Tax=Nonomuraea sp. NPDC050790 TaxID=3364371 RepID=UPI0037BB7881